MKTKKLVMGVIICLLVGGAPMTAAAMDLEQQIQENSNKIQEKSNQINEKSQVIESIKGETTTVTALKAKTDAAINAKQAEVEQTLAEKNQSEKRVAELFQQIADLENAIEKRELALQNQARSIQTSNTFTTMVETLLSSSSVTDAISKGMAISKIMGANKETMEQQAADKIQVEALKAEEEAQLQKLADKTAALQDQQAALVQLKLDQEVQLKGLAVELAKEESAKASLEKERKAAEEKRSAAVKALAKQRAREKAAREAAEKKAAAEKAAAEKAAKAAAKAAAGQTANTSSKNNSVNPNPAADTSDASSAVSSSGWRSPLGIALVVTSPFGWRVDPTGSSGNNHQGIDFAGASGSAIYAAASGTVVAATYGSSPGNYVVIKHTNGYYSYYMHLNRPSSLTVGQTISAGGYVGGMGTTGNSTGVHLHFGISTDLWSGYVNPASFLGI